MSQEDLDSPNRPSTSKLNKQLADDLDYVQHRIAKLKIEAENCQAKIHGNERRISTIQQRREQAEREILYRKNVQMRKQNADQSNREEIARARQEARDRIEEAKQRTIEEKREIVLHQRRLQRIYECQLNVNREEDREKTLNKHTQIRELEASGKHRTERQAAKKVQGVRHDQRIELQRTSMEREEKESLMTKLRKQEEALARKVEEMKQQMRESNERLRVVYDEGSRPSTSHTPRPPPKRADQRKGEDQSPEARKDSLPPIKNAEKADSADASP